MAFGPAVLHFILFYSILFVGLEGNPFSFSIRRLLLLLLSSASVPRSHGEASSFFIFEITSRRLAFFGVVLLVLQFTFKLSIPKG